MKVEMVFPIGRASGKVAEGYYTRRLYGKQIIQRCPKQTKPASAAQLAARKRFVEQYAQRRAEEGESRDVKEMVTEW